MTKEVHQSRVEENYEGLFLIGTGVFKNRRGWSELVIWDVRVSMFDTL